MAADAYTDFAEVYDLFMDDIPYEEWSAYVIDLLQEQGIINGLVLDLGCGTGAMTRLLAQAGYDMIGVDVSADMLQIAAEKSREILYLCQDMREFELYGTVCAVVSTCDSINYILEYNDLVQTFSLVNNYLDPGGIFIFDMNTAYKYETILGEKTIAENRPEGSFIWDNYYDSATMVNEYALTLFIREEDGRYRRQEEFHYQRAYSLDLVRQALWEAGMEFMAAYDAFTRNDPLPYSERIYILARECKKKGAD